MIHHRPLSLVARHVLRPAFCLLLSAHCSLPAAHAQSATATLSGTVEDQNNAVVPGANVKAINTSTGLERQTTTNDEGSFTIPLLPPSSYMVRVERNGFASVEISNVILNVGDQKSLQIQLKAGRITEMVQINADAPLISDSPAVGTVVDRQFVANLPLNGRSFQSLFELTPGVVLTKADSINQGQFSVNGQRANANYFTIDGVSANVGTTPVEGLRQTGGGSLPAFSAAGGTSNLVSVDALQEFRIQTSTYAPEFGRMPGGQISIVTRSGTNDFHGTVFDYFRNDVLDANDWFANRQGLKRPALRQNNFGGVLGGPLLFPRFGEGGRQPWYSGRNRTFFFFSYEGLRLRQPQVQIKEVPSLNARRIAPAQIQQLLNAFPIPNGRDLGSNKAEFSASYSDPTTLDATSIRIDHTISSKLNLFGRYNDAPSETITRGFTSTALSVLNASQTNTRTLTGGAIWTITPLINNDFRANWSGTRGINNGSLDTFGGASPLPDSLVFPPFASSQNSSFLVILNNVTGGLLRGGKGINNAQQQINFVDHLSIVKNSHQLKFGIDYRRLAPIAEERVYSVIYIFSDVNGALTGRTQATQINASAGPRFPLFTNFSAYAQDTWKATPRLTFTYGVRWEVNPPPHERNGNDVATLIGLDNPATMTLAPIGTPLWNTTYDNFAPRVGVAYHLSSKQGRETVLRGGWGIFYDLGTGRSANAYNNRQFTNTRLVPNLPFPPNPAQIAPAPLGLNPPLGGNFLTFDPNLKLPRTYQWNLAVEQSLGSNQAISASYVGAAGRQLLRNEFLSRGLLGGNPLFQLTARVNVVRNTSTSDYHALQIQFNRRLSQGFQALASYSWSHSLDDASDDSSDNVPGVRIDPRQERGPSVFDVRHSLTASVTYNIPAPKAGQIGDAILSNWSTDAIFRVRSATPINVITGTDVLGLGLTTVVRPDLILGVPLYLDDPQVGGGRRINRAAFATPPSGRQGTLGRNALRGFNASQLDISLRRQFNFTERLNLQFRAEVFNIFNHPNFADPSGNLASGLFGQSTQMLGRSLGSGQGSGFNSLYQIGGPRSVQLSLKVSF